MSSTSTTQTSDWNSDLVLEFLKLYQAEPCIYDPKHLAHKKRFKVIDAWMKIKRALSVDIELSEIKRKKRFTHGRFPLSFKKKKASIKSGVSADEVYRPTWFAFELMEGFLGSLYDCEPTYNTETENSVCLTEVKKECDTSDICPGVKSEGAEFPIIRCEDPLDKTVIKEECDTDTDPLQLSGPDSHPARAKSKVLIKEVRTQPYICLICNKIFLCCVHLEAHYIVSHADEVTYPSEHKCLLCNKCYPKRRHLKMHVNNAHTDGSLFLCSFCNTEFEHESVFNEHIRTHTGERMFSCEVCGESFPYEKSLLMHVDTHVDNCPVCKQSFHCSSQQKTHECTISGEAPISCQVCRKSFHNSSELKTHECTVIEEAPISCQVCKKSFHNSSELKTHECTVIEEAPISCQVCKKSFHNSSELKTHECTVIEEAPISCQVCKKSFHNSSELKTHECTVIEEAPISCQICKKSFHYSSELKTHECIVGEAPIFYLLLKEPFQYLSQVKKRKCNEPLQIESKQQKLESFNGPPSCQFCKKSFVCTSELKKHLCKNVSEGPFSCKSCRESFHYLSQMKKHTCRFSSCHLCNKSFDYSSELKEHRCTKLELNRHHTSIFVVTVNK